MTQPLDERMIFGCDYALSLDTLELANDPASMIREAINQMRRHFAPAEVLRTRVLANEGFLYIRMELWPSDVERAETPVRHETE